MLYQANQSEFSKVMMTMEVKSQNFHWQNFDYLFNHIADNIASEAFEFLPKEEQAVLGVHLVNNVLAWWEMNNGYHTKEQAIEEAKQNLFENNSIEFLLEINVIAEVDFSSLGEDFDDSFYSAYSPSELSEDEQKLIVVNQDEIFNQLREPANLFYFLEINKDSYVRESDLCAIDMDYTNQEHLIDAAYEALPDRMADKDFLKEVMYEDTDNIKRVSEHDENYEDLARVTENTPKGNLKKLVEAHFLAKDLKIELTFKPDTITNKKNIKL